MKSIALSGRWAAAAFGSLAVLLAVACQRSEISKHDSVVTAAAAAVTDAPEVELAERPLRVAMSAAFVSEEGVPVYEEIIRYLTRETERPVEFIRGLAYRTINDMLEAGAVDMGFVCGLPYVLARDRPQPAVMLIAAPVMKAPRYKGVPKYYSDLIVRKDSPYQSLQDLKGRTYVYNDEYSNSGYNMPRYRLLQLGLSADFFGNVLRSGSHEESIRMVASGQADASFVDSLVIDYDRAKGLGETRLVRVIESIGPAGIPPVVVSATVPEDRREALRQQLITMHVDPEGRKILDAALVERFVAVDDSNYDDIRAMKAAAERAGFSGMRPTAEAVVAQGAQ